MFYHSQAYFLSTKDVVAAWFVCAALAACGIACAGALTGVTDPLITAGYPRGFTLSLRTSFAMTAFGVRRDKAALSSGCKAHPTIAPAGSNRSSHGGNEMAEAFE